MYFHTMKKNKMFKTGMISLFPAVIISSILLILMINVGQISASALYRASLSEDKMQSTLAVRSCLHRLVVKIKQDKSYSGGNLNISGYDCLTNVVSDLNNTKVLKVSVQVGKSKSIGLMTLENF